jgi:predicted transcriptional regulator
MNNNVITFSKEQYKQILSKCHIILKGKRGSTSKNSRIRKKNLKKVISKIVTDYVKDTENEKDSN